MTEPSSRLFCGHQTATRETARRCCCWRASCTALRRRSPSCGRTDSPRRPACRRGSGRHCLAGCCRRPTPRRHGRRHRSRSSYKPPPARCRPELLCRSAAGMSAANAGAANTTMAAAPSRSFFIIVPLFTSCNLRSNNVASIWLLRGIAVSNRCPHCDKAATARVPSHLLSSRQPLCPSAARICRGPCNQVQLSLKSDWMDEREK